MTQRADVSEGKPSQDRVQRLEAIGFIWCRQEHAWDKMYRRLVNYKKACGDCDVPYGWREDPQLGSWVVKQRYQRMKRLLREERVRKLDDVGIRCAAKGYCVCSPPA